MTKLGSQKLHLPKKQKTTTIFLLLLLLLLFIPKKYTFAPQIARKLVMAGQAGTRTTLTKTSYHVNL